MGLHCSTFVKTQLLDRKEELLGLSGDELKDTITEINKSAREEAKYEMELE